jgi:hypothetical protein
MPYTPNSDWKVIAIPVDSAGNPLGHTGGDPITVEVTNQQAQSADARPLLFFYDAGSDPFPVAGDTEYQWAGTPNGAAHVNLRNNDGDEVGTVADPLQVVVVSGGGSPVITDIEDGAGDSVMDAANNAVRVNLVAGGSSGTTPKQILATFTRPNNTDAYAAGDAVTDSTSAPTVMTFSGCASANGGSGYILGALMVDSANQSTKGIFELWLFDTTVTPDNDNAVFTPTDAECATLVAVIPLVANYVGDAQAGASGNAVYASPEMIRPFTCGVSSDDLFGLLVVRNAYTPVAQEAFTVRLRVVQN